MTDQYIYVVYDVNDAWNIAAFTTMEKALAYIAECGSDDYGIDRVMLY